VSKEKNVKLNEKRVFFKLTEGLTSAQLGEKKKWSKCPHCRETKMGKKREKSKLVFSQ
jgi:hypothetical protein